MVFSKSADDKIAQSDIRTMSIECEKRGGINLSQGICDLATPKPVLEGAKSAIDAEFNTYTRYDGAQELREAISRKLSRQNGIKADPETEVVVSAGATGAMFCAALALLKPGDEVILFEPYYSYHVLTLNAVGAKPVFVKTNPPDWHFDLSELEAKITSKTKGIIINTPSNPSGKVFGKEELLAIGELCNKHGIIVFTDEIYEYFVYDGKKHISPASLYELAERTVTISGYSKTYSITGWRIGYSACKKEWATKIGHMNDLLYVCAPSPLQLGVAQGINKLPQSFYESISLEYKRKRDLLCSALSDAGLKPHIPPGAYYVLADAGALKGRDSHEKAMGLLEKTGIAAVPGRAFYSGKDGENMLRFCFAKKDDVLKDACERLRNL